LLLTTSLLACSGADEPEEIAAGIDPTAMDRSVDPCEDFFQYACGGFIASHPLGDDGGSISRLAQAFFATERVEQDIVAAGEPLIFDYFRSCQDAAGGQQPRTELDALLTQIDAITDPPTLASALAQLHATSVDALFSFGSTKNLAEPTQRIAYVGQGGIGMPDRSYYLDASAPEIAAYRNHITALSALLGVNDPALPDAVIAVETKLAQAMLPPDDLRDPEQSFHLADLASLEAQVADFPWSAYLAAIEAPAIASLDVSVPQFFDGLEAVLKSTSTADMQRYLRWRAIDAYAYTLGDDAVALEYAFHYGVFYGFSTPLPRPEYCLRQTAGALPWPMSRAYVARAFPPDAATRASTLMSDVRAALRDDLAGTAWLDAATRKAAIAKLDALQVAVGAPSSWPSTDGLTIDPTSFADATTAVARFYWKRDIARIGTMADDGWFMPPITVNAAYSATRNAIDFPAAILQAPVFDATYADAVNYGAIGSIMGHELTHGFDDQGRRFDASGRLAEWWTASTAASFAERAQCVVDQYAAIEAVPGVLLDGELTLGENIADLGGVKLSLAALGDRGDPRTFFLAYGQAWCENDRPDLLETRARTDPHSPPRARVNAVLANLPQFAEAYGCSAGQPMAPEKRCAVW
jgi:endothelin-converting enzyme/putative endopeptidase